MRKTHSEISASESTANATPAPPSSRRLSVGSLARPAPCRKMGHPNSAIFAVEGVHHRQIHNHFTVYGGVAAKPRESLVHEVRSNSSTDASMFLVKGQ